MTDDTKRITDLACSVLTPDDAAELRARVARHGAPVDLSRDGRDWLKEAREELLDAVWYLAAWVQSGRQHDLARKTADIIARGGLASALMLIRNLGHRGWP